MTAKDIERIHEINLAYFLQWQKDGKEEVLNMKKKHKRWRYAALHGHLVSHHGGIRFDNGLGIDGNLESVIATELLEVE